MLGLVQDLVTVVFKRSSHAISCVVRVELCEPLLDHYFVCVECVKGDFFICFLCEVADI